MAQNRKPKKTGDGNDKVTLDLSGDDNEVIASSKTGDVVVVDSPGIDVTPAKTKQVSVEATKENMEVHNSTDVKTDANEAVINVEDTSSDYTVYMK